MRQSISVVVPVYNSEQTIVAVCERVRAVLEPLTRELEFVLVDDGSRDGSWRCIEEFARRDPRVRGIHLMRNFGQHNALLCGIRSARHELIVTLDDDGQNPPEEIPKLLEQLTPELDVVYGTPADEQHGMLRDWASVITKLVLKRAMGVDVARSISAFRVFRTHLRDAFADYRGSIVSIDVLLTWGTTRFAAIPVKHHPREVGTSNYSVARLIAHAMNMMTGFSTFPLQVASVTGLAAVVLGIVIFGWVIGRILISGVEVPGFAFLACIITIFAGAQMFSIGIIGEYLGRMHFRTMDHPCYVVQQEVGAGTGDGAP